MRDVLLALVLAVGGGALGAAGMTLWGGDEQADVRGCARYGAEGDAFDYCVLLETMEVADLDTMMARCRDLGPWEADCRARWVEHWSDPRSPYDDDALLAACASDDCRFTVLDARPRTDVLAQVERCTERSGPMGEDCSRHALQRWMLARPDASEVGRVLTGRHSHHTLVAHYAGQAIGCTGQGTCVGEDQATCRSGVEFSHDKPENCRAGPAWPVSETSSPD